MVMTVDEDGLLEAPDVPSLEDVDLVDLQDQGGALSIEDAAVAVRVSVAAVRMWIRRGQVFAFGWDGLTWVGQKSLYDCERARRRTPQGRPRNVVE